jgi:hypothetical protein
MKPTLVNHLRHIDTRQAETTRLRQAHSNTQKSESDGAKQIGKQIGTTLRSHLSSMVSAMNAAETCLPAILHEITRLKGCKHRLLRFEGKVQVGLARSSKRLSLRRQEKDAFLEAEQEYHAARVQGAAGRREDLRPPEFFNAVGTPTFLASEKALAMACETTVDLRRRLHEVRPYLDGVLDMLCSLRGRLELGLQRARALHQEDYLSLQMVSASLATGAASSGVPSQPIMGTPGRGPSDAQLAGPFKLEDLWSLCDEEPAATHAARVFDQQLKELIARETRILQEQDMLCNIRLRENTQYLLAERELTNHRQSKNDNRLKLARVRSYELQVS